VLLALGVAIWTNPAVPEVELRWIKNPVWFAALFVQVSVIPLDDVAAATRFDGAAGGDVGVTVSVVAVATLLNAEVPLPFTAAISYQYWVLAVRPVSL
jgi:hypothetical protein